MSFGRLLYGVSPATAPESATAPVPPFLRRTMKTLMHVVSSPRSDRSYSFRAADSIVKSYAKLNPQDKIHTLDVFEEPLPSFDGDALQAKYAILHGQSHTPEQKQAWKNIEIVIEKFKAADRYVFSVPMWNFGLPYRLKQLFDVIIQPGYTFSFSPDKGYQGLLTDKKAIVVLARGGEYGMENGYDFQGKYIRHLLGFIGITDVKTLLVEPTLAGGPETAKSKLDAALASADSLAKELC
jgi:FMN-dependent NADH-azoreductase